MSDYTLSMTNYQMRVGRWCYKLFGSEIASNIQIRCYRFIEEALELVQSLGCTKEKALEVLNYVYSRPVGKPFQEVGGTMITLAALCAATQHRGPDGIEIEEAMWAEMWRCETPEVMAKVLAKQTKKVNQGAVLPAVDVEQEAAQTFTARWGTPVESDQSYMGFVAGFKAARGVE